MKNLFLISAVFSVYLFTFASAQDKSEKEIVNEVATKFLNSMADQIVPSSEMIAAESLDRSKEISLSMALSYDSTGKSNAMLLLPANEIKNMPSAKVWDYTGKIAGSMKKLDMNIEWNIVNTEIKNDNAFVTYAVQDRENKVMQLKKEIGKWKIVLSFTSIF